MLKSVTHIRFAAAILAVSVCVSASAALPAFAEEDGKTLAQQIQDAMLYGDGTLPDGTVAEGSPAETESKPSSGSATLYEIPQDEIDARMGRLDPENPDRDEVASLRAAYEGLKIADKMNIINLSILEEAEKTLAGSEPEDLVSAEQEPEVTRPNPKEDNTRNETVGTEFLFALSAASPQATLIFHYTVDDNHDSKMDPVTFSLLGPDGSETDIRPGKEEIKSSDKDIRIIWLDTYMQMDIAKAPAGGWMVQSSLPVTFSRSQYEGAVVPIETESGMSGPDTPVPVRGTEYGPYIKAALFILLLIGALVGFMFFSKRYFGGTSGVKKAKPLKPSLPSLQKKKTEDKGMSKEEEDKRIMEEVKREIEEQKRVDEQIEADAQAERERRNAYIQDSQDDQMDITVRDVEPSAEDDDLNMFQEHVGDTGVLSKKDAPTPKKPKGARFG